MKKIAIIGATGYIGRSLMREFFTEKSGKYHFFLFSRSQEKLKAHMLDVREKTQFEICAFEDFNSKEYDVILNCAGVGSIETLKKTPMAIFEVTEEMDSRIISYLSKNKKTLYINLSSGAVYGTNFMTPVIDTTQTILSPGFIGGYESYTAAKINAEAKHRALQSYNIVDIRVFAFFSALVDTTSQFFMTEIADCIVHKKVFITSNEDMVRDYIIPRDLVALIETIIKKHTINDFFNVYSRAPVSKLELLDFLKKNYDLKYEFTESPRQPLHSATPKSVYASSSRKAGEVLGYEPMFTSAEGIAYELDKIIK